MGSTQYSILHGKATVASDIAIRTQQAEERREADTALKAGRTWEDRQLYTVSQLHRERVDLYEEVYVVVDLTSNDLDSCAFVVSIFPYTSGDTCLWFDLEHAQAVLRLAHIAATPEQLDILEHTATIVGYAFETREEVIQHFPALLSQHGRTEVEDTCVPLEEALAKFFHDTYERLAPTFHSQTCASSAVPWTQVPADNKHLMIAVCKEVIQHFLEYGREA